MSVESTVKGENSVVGYPKLMVHEQCIILVTAENEAKSSCGYECLTGMVVRCAVGSRMPIGYYSNTFNKDVYEDFEGHITIKNK